MAYRARLKEFDDLLQEDVINVKKLKTLSFNGIPDIQGVRALCWKLLLNYLPPERDTWSSYLAKKRELYKNLIDEMVVMPGTQDTTGDVGSTDHPLSMNPDSQWQTFFKDNEVLLQIDKDVRRLCPDISFFQQPTEFPCSEIVNSNDVKRLHSRVQRRVLKCANVERKGLGITKGAAGCISFQIGVLNIHVTPSSGVLMVGLYRDLRLRTMTKKLKGGVYMYKFSQIALSVKKAIEDYAPMAEGQEAHWEVVERILFLYAKLNPGQSYVQGMNEIIGPIYYAFACDPNIEFREFAEADCFFCFTNLMSEIRDIFIKTLDEADCGINNMMSKLLVQLKNNDLDIWLRFQQQELRPQYYSFRWITLLLSQEFSLPDVLRIWDSLFSDEKRFDFLIYICCAMIVILRNQLNEGDFPSNLKLLQNFPPMDVQIILSKAVELVNKKN